MKKTMQKTLSLALVVLCLLGLAACGKTVEETGLWKDAIYAEDTTLGSGEKTVVVEVKAEDKTVTFTLKTDKTTVGDALLEHDLIAGEEGDYGLYIQSVNGMVADYDKDKSYWAFYIDGEYAMSSVDTTEIDEAAVYRLEHAK